MLHDSCRAEYTSPPTPRRWPHLRAGPHRGNPARARKRPRHRRSHEDGPQTAKTDILMVNLSGAATKHGHSGPRVWTEGGKVNDAIEFKKKPGIVAYLTAGDPDLATTREIALAAIDNGANVDRAGRAIQRSAGRRPGDPARQPARGCTRSQAHRRARSCAAVARGAARLWAWSSPTSTRWCAWE